MHLEALNFTLFVKNTFPEHLQGKTVLDVGSGDINGNNRDLFTQCTYHGNDVIAGSNVTIVSKTKDLSFANETFDTIVSTECFEHDPEYAASLQKIYQLLKPGGLFFFTCASTDRAEHGTRRTTPGCSLGCIGQLPDMQDYYQNLTIHDVDTALPLSASFHLWDSYYNANSRDLYFVGIKCGGGETRAQTLSVYSGPAIEKTTF